MKIDINKMELPEWDVVKASPIQVVLDDGREMTFEIPCVEKYFDFESKYVQFVAGYFIKFSQVNFLEYKDFVDLSLKEKMIKELYKALQDKKVQKEFVGILNKYFTANFKIKRIMKYINPMQLSYLFLFIHKVVETVKKKFLETLVAMDHRLSETFSISSNENLGKIVPRY